jgi:NAD(P)-dependent dehydrogenase (short-subunit alcohol dehydrogenase family)
MWTNALAPIRIAERLLPRVADGGTVAFMSSVLGSIGENTSGGYDLYRISKASLNMLARGFAATAAKDRRITVLNLHPGWVRTDMGGSAAPLSVEDSVRGLADVLETRRSAKHLYLDYQGREIPW